MALVPLGFVTSPKTLIVRSRKLKKTLIRSPKVRLNDLNVITLIRYCISIWTLLRMLKGLIYCGNQLEKELFALRARNEF